MTVAEPATVIPTAPRQYAGGDWLRQQRVEISPLGHRVADMLGEWARGLYHISKAVMSDGSDFTSDYCIQLLYRPGYVDLCTVDGNGLTQLVFLAHDYGLRVDIDPHGFGYLKLRFWQRAREGSYAQRCPTLEEAVANYRAMYPSQDQP